jgi:CxxC-x17-CxxC domain-containing protein
MVTRGNIPSKCMDRAPCGRYIPADSGRFSNSTLSDGMFGRRVVVKVYTDRAIACLDCGQEFSFTAGEQEFYAQRGFTEPPKRCPSCRAIRKAQRSGGRTGFEGAGDSGNWSAPSYDSGYSYAGASAGYGGSGGDGGYRERRSREMFDAVCAECGKTAQVPFRPSGMKPVYCSDCFQNRR